VRKLDWRKILIALIDPCYRLAMPRATIIVDVTHPDEVAASEDWLAKWTSSITYRSENQGCGCCVNIWDVEAPEEALAALPSNLKGDSDWVQHGHGH